MITQRVCESIRIRGSDEPSKLDMIFTRDPSEIVTVNYNCPYGRVTI